MCTTHSLTWYTPSTVNSWHKIITGAFVLEEPVLLTRVKIVQGNSIKNLVFAMWMPFWQKLKDHQVIFTFSLMRNIQFFAHKICLWITFCVYTVFSWYNYTFTCTCHYRLDFLRWNATFQWTTWILWHNPTPIKKIHMELNATLVNFPHLYQSNLLLSTLDFTPLGVNFLVKKNLHFITYSACMQQSPLRQQPFYLFEEQRQQNIFGFKLLKLI